MRFLRHDGIYRSDVSFILVNPAQMPPPVGRPRCRAIARDGRSTPCPSSAMSSGRLFLDRVGRHQSPSPLRRHPQNNSLQFRRARHYHRTAGSVLTVCVTRGNKRAVRLSLEDFDGVREFNVDELPGIDLALEELHEYDAHLAHLVELKYFCGLTDDEIGKAQHMSFAQVRRDWECARAWLRKKLA